MASPVLHIKDAYYFEVPKFLWQWHCRSKADFPDVWVRLDPDFQLWEAQRLYARALQSIEGAPAEWGELREQYLDWREDHANFGKPLDVMLQEQYAKAKSEYGQWLAADPAHAGVSFTAYLQQAQPDGAWFSRWLDQDEAHVRWNLAKQSAGDVAAYQATQRQWSSEKIEAYNHHLDGKILIPQPFGQLRNLHEPESGFCISKFMVVQMAVALVMLFVFWRLGKKIAGGGPPRGRVWNLLEAFLVYLREDVARPAIGHHDGDRFVPLIWTIFMFVLSCNLCGLLPWVGTPTGCFGVTSGLALVTFLTGVVCGMRRFGPLGYFTNQVPSMDLPLLLAIPIKPMILAIEVLGTCIRHGVLAVRLLANMVAGHLVLLGIMGLAFGATAAAAYAQAPDWKWWMTAVIAVVSSTLFSCLELLVAFIQAYIFAFLSALFIGAAIHHH